MLCLVVLKACVPKLCVVIQCSAVLRGSLFNVCHCNELRRINFISIKAVIIITRQGEVFVLLYVFCSLYVSTISRQPVGRFMPNFACGRTLVPDVSSPLLRVSGPPRGGRKKGKVKFSWKTYVECEWRVCVSSTDALVIITFQTNKHIILKRFHFLVASLTVLVYQYETLRWNSDMVPLNGGGSNARAMKITICD